MPLSSKLMPVEILGQCIVPYEFYHPIIVFTTYCISCLLCIERFFVLRCNVQQILAFSLHAGVKFCIRDYIIEKSPREH